MSGTRLRARQVFVVVAAAGLLGGFAVTASGCGRKSVSVPVAAPAASPPIQSPSPSLSPDPKPSPVRVKVKVPNVLGLKFKDARQQLHQAGLRIEIVERRPSQDPSFTVLHQVPKPGKYLVEHGFVHVRIAKHVAPPPPPAATGGVTYGSCPPPDPGCTFAYQTGSTCYYNCGYTYYP